MRRLGGEGLACSPIELLKEIAAHDAEATRELEAMIPNYKSEPDYVDLHRRIRDCIEANVEVRHGGPDGKE